MQRASEDLAESEYLNLIRWAVRKAPELLRMLRIAYLFGQDYCSPRSFANQARGGGLFGKSPSSNGHDEPRSEKLADVEREHIRRVLTESATVVEAALKLGIDNSTLWRKRKRYNL